MKKRLQGMIAGVLIGVMLPCGVAFAKQATEAIKVTYNNIKIFIDGKEYQPTDVNGNVVEPFIYNGTTYLPVRAIANAFDKEVDWEAQTSTVTLGSKSYDWLDQMGYVDYEYSAVGNSFSAIPEGTMASDGIKYDRGIQFSLRDYTTGMWGNGGTIINNDGSMECNESISYLLNKSYKTFDGTLTFLGDEYDSGQTVIKFWGDGNLMYTSPIMSYGMKSSKFSIDVSNVKLLEISVEYLNIQNGNKISCPAIADARLSKK